MEHADGIGQVEGPVAEGQREDVGLYQVGRRHLTQVLGCRVHRTGEVHPDHLRTPPRHHLGVAAGPDTRVEHDPTPYILGAEARLEPEAVLRFS